MIFRRRKACREDEASSYSDGSRTTPQTVLQRVADGAKELCRSDGAAIALCELGTEAAVIRYWAGMSSRGYYGVRIERGRGIGGIVLATGRPCRTDHYACDPRLSQEYLPLMQAGRTVGVLVVPIRSGERVEGLLYVGSEQPRTFTEHDEAILQRLADHAAVALHNAELYAAAERRRRTAESLTEVGRLLSQSLDSAEVRQRNDPLQAPHHADTLWGTVPEALSDLWPRFRRACPQRSGGQLIPSQGTHDTQRQQARIRFLSGARSSG